MHIPKNSSNKSLPKTQLQPQLNQSSLNQSVSFSIQEQNQLLRNNNDFQEDQADFKILKHLSSIPTRQHKQQPQQIQQQQVLNPTQKPRVNNLPTSRRVTPVPSPNNYSNSQVRLKENDGYNSANSTKLLVNCFKPFMIQSNVKKFANKLMQKILYFRRVKPSHFEVINDVASNYRKTVNASQKTILLPSKSYIQSKNSVFILTMQRFLKSCYRNLDKCCLQYIKAKIKLCGHKAQQVIPVIYPDSKISLFLSSMLIIIQIFYILIIPMDIAFGPQLLAKDLLSVNMLFQFLFFLIMLSNFTRQQEYLTKYFNRATFSEGLLVNDRVHIIQIYWSNGFMRDLLSFMSLLISLIQQVNGGSEVYQLIILIFYLQIQPILKSREEQIGKSLFTKTQKHWFQFFGLLFQILFAEHIFACIYFFVSTMMYQAGYKSGYEQYDLINMDWISQYIFEIYFASTTMITVGYGDIVPQNNGERLFCVIFMLISSIQLSYSVNTIGSIIQEIKNENEKNQKKIRLINEYMVNRQITSNLQMRIREYLNYFWREEEQEAQLHLQQVIVNQLPENLKQQLLKEANRTIIQDCPLFQKFNFTTPFLQALYKIIGQINLLPESIIQNEKQGLQIEGACIYFVEKGEVDEVVPQGITVNTYSEKQYFGFEEFISGETQNKNIFKSTKFTRLYVIPKEKFMELLKDFPEDNEIFSMVKDDLLCSNLNDLFNPFCRACLIFGHNLKTCPLVHHISDREKIMKQYLYLNIQIRKSYQRKRQRNYFQTLPDRQFFEDCGNAYVSENPGFVKYLYEDPSCSSQSDSDSDTDSSGSSEAKEPEINQQRKENIRIQKRGSQQAFLSNDLEQQLTSIEEVAEHGLDGNPSKVQHTMETKNSGRSSIQNARKYSSRLTAFQLSNLNKPRKSNFSKQQQQQYQKKQTQQQQSKPQNLRMSVFSGLVRSAFNKTAEEKKPENQLFQITKLLQQQQIEEDQEKIIVNKPMKKCLYSDERLMLSQMEKFKYVYQEKMNNYLNESDLRNFELLLVRLRVLSKQEFTEQFDVGKDFGKFKPSANPSSVIFELTVLQNSFEQLKRIKGDLGQQYDDMQLNLQSYLFFPFQYVMKYRKRSSLKNPRQSDSLVKQEQVVMPKRSSRRQFTKKLQNQRKLSGWFKGRFEASENEEEKLSS